MHCGIEVTIRAMKRNPFSIAFCIKSPKMDVILGEITPNKL